MRRIQLSLFTVILSAPAFAQFDATYLLVSSNTVSPSSPTTTIEVWATWTDPGLQFPYLFLRSDYDLTAGDGEFANPAVILRGTAGVIAGNVVSGANIYQIHFPAIGFFGSEDNPILLATYEWSTADFSPRIVSLDTSNTTSFLLDEATLRSTSGPIQMYPYEFTPGTGVIHVVPAPAAWFVLALPLATARRRRRS